MDQARQIRFLIPPFILYGSLLWGLYWSDPCHNRWWDLIENSEHILLYVSIAAASVLPLGFLIGTISIVVLKILFAFSNHTYETWVSPKCLGQMKRSVSRLWKPQEFAELPKPTGKPKKNSPGDESKQGKPKKNGPADRKWPVRLWSAFKETSEKRCKEHLTEVTFNHGVLNEKWPGVHTWLVRRWNAFNVSAHSLCALVLAFFIAGPALGLSWSWPWAGLSFVLGVALFWICWEAWKETMKMMEFQSDIDCEPVE